MICPVLLLAFRSVGWRFRRRTHWLQEARRMRFEEACSGLGRASFDAGLGGGVAGGARGLSGATWRYIHRYESEGLDKRMKRQGLLA